CSDGNVCTDDGCDPKVGCSHTANSTACDDGNACTVGDTCKASVCAAGGSALSCDDKNGCTTDSCDPKAGCVFAANTLACSDGDACTTPDVCSGSACKPGPAANCDDGQACTYDFCDPAKGCLHTDIGAAPDGGSNPDSANAPDCGSVLDSNGAADAAADASDAAADASSTADLAYQSLGQPCQTAGDCGAGMVCKHAGCNGPAMCVFAPVACPAGEAVCGCDGKTYANACEALAASVGVASYGVCGTCVSQTDYCWSNCSGPAKFSYPNLCQFGVKGYCGCTGNPIGVWDICDWTGAKGALVAWVGSCPGKFGVCGQPYQEPCPSGSTCVRPPGQCGGSGMCITSPAPAGCPSGGQAVCGCDAKTYENACVAVAAGVSVWSSGPCDPAALPCSKAIGWGYGPELPCPSGSTCLALGCEGGLVFGKCVVQPSPCTQVSDPVCLCNNKTAVNACEPLQYSIPIKALGACP
ncbi:MAG: hypothetical protein HY902_00305, partial [Deltaproteobacteria bacterium]|nr:hypothetical protein [Deltaproteobacteria bacterium]